MAQQIEPKGFRIEWHTDDMKWHLYMVFKEGIPRELFAGAPFSVVHDAMQGFIVKSYEYNLKGRRFEVR
jgi:hypothetical protein